VAYNPRVEVDLVAEHDEREVLGIARTGLHEELVAPRVEVLKGLCDVYVKDQNARIRAAVERDAEALEALLPGRVPDLESRERQKRGRGASRG
jgi:hypothetical protein